MCARPQVSITLNVRVVPNASRSALAGWQEEVLRIRLNAPPVEGKANKALLKFLSARLGVRPREIDILSGETSRNKRLAVVNAPHDWKQRLTP